MVIIGLTGMEDKVHTARARALGQDEVLGKPFSNATVLSQILHRLLAARGGV
jgi:CheY-like chemotaxis protein